MPTDNSSFESLFGGKAPIEPNAEMRSGAGILFEFYTANLEAGFTPVQAMQVLIAYIAKGS